MGADVIVPAQQSSRAVSTHEVTLPNRPECYLCGGEVFHLVEGVADRYDISICRKCGLGKTEGFELRAAPPSDAVKPGGTYRRDLCAMSKRRGELAGATAKRIQHLAGSGCILDIGCSGGRLVREVSNRGVTAYGIDVEIEPLVLAGKSGVKDLAAGDAHALPFGDGSFDLVHLSHTLEHLMDPGAVLSEAYRVLKPEGLLMASVPNHTGMLPRITRNWVGYAPWMHVWHFSPDSLVTLLRKARFRPLKLTRCNMETPEIESRWKKFAWICLAAIQKHIGMGDSMSILAKRTQ
ncbi:MAG: methyltransferase domain-containing protein [Candidatus Eisenbacteria bacterium]